MEKYNEWFYNLDESNKLDIIEGIYPDEVGLIDSDELWERTDWRIRLEIYSGSEDFITEEDIEAARTDAAERENHRKEVEGEIE